MIAIIDYGAGNLRSVQKACEAVGAAAVITADKDTIAHADHVILPGVGAFGDCMHSLNRANLTETVRKAALGGTPFFGICLGMQLLFERSEESPGVKGLGIFPGEIVKIPKKEGYKIPHMGWNSLDFCGSSPLFEGLSDQPYVYFVHSYYAVPENDGIIAAKTRYCGDLTVSVHDKNIVATQFHPEKSGDVGLKILKNFVNMGGER